jgi:hypothetical protein
MAATRDDGAGADLLDIPCRSLKVATLFNSHWDCSVSLRDIGDTASGHRDALVRPSSPRRGRFAAALRCDLTKCPSTDGKSLVSWSDGQEFGPPAVVVSFVQ